MEYTYSAIVDPSEYETEGLCDGIDVRKNYYTEMEDRGAIRAHHDWSKYVGPCHEYRGTLGPVYSFMTVCVPECIPERLELIAYANEFAFMHDDVLDQIDLSESDRENDDMMQAFLEGAEKASISSDSQDNRKSGRKQMQSQLFLEMMAVDRECAVESMKAWAKFLEVGSGRQHSKRFTTLEEYLPYRIMDVGEMFWYGVVTYGMALHIPAHETEICRKLMAPAWIAVGLQNDLWSWPKEKDEAERKGEDHVINAIWVLMQEHQVDVQGAQDICRKLTKEYVAKYVQIIKDTRDDESLSKDLRKYIEAFQYAISGNVVWSLTCPRYNPTANFNQTQLDWMHNSVPALVSSSSSTESSKDLDQREISTSSSSDPSSGYSDVFALPPDLPNLCEDSQGIFSFEEVTEAPYEYISSMPSKGIRDQFIDALNVWFKVPEAILDETKDVIKMLHNSSLLLDDFQDGSLLRRGQPSAHTIFGAPQAINSSSYHIVKAIARIQSFSSPEIVKGATERILALFWGQAMDIHWTYTTTCPTMEEYLSMIDYKTGSLFILACQLMTSHSHVPISDEVKDQVNKMTTLLGRYFQIRDDYQNLVSADYQDQKGFCEDLDEGKYSLPMLYTVKNLRGRQSIQLASLLSTRREQGKLTREQKQAILDQMKSCGSLTYTKSMLEGLYVQLRDMAGELEARFAEKNPILRASIELLRI